MSNATATNRKAALETTLSKICGVAVEITIRSGTGFTISAEGDATRQIEKAKSFLALSGALSNWQAAYHEDCDFTCALFNLA